MAKIPTYDSAQVQDRPLTGSQNTAASPALFGAGGAQISQFGGQLAAAGGAMVDLAAREQEKSDLEAVQRTDALYKEKLQDFQTQAKQKYSGINVGELDQAFKDWHAEALSELAGGLQSDRQRKAFTLQAAKNYNLVRHDLGQFYLSEKKRNETAALNATIALDTHAGASAATDAQAAESRRSILQNIAGYAAAHNLGEEEAGALKLKSLTGLHAQRIQNMVDADPEGAKAYFAANKGEIDGGAHDQITRLLKAGEIKGGSLRLQFELQPLGGLQAQTKELDRRFKDGGISAELRDATLQRLEHIEARRKADRGEWEKNILGQAQDFFLKNPGKSAIDLPTPLYEALKSTGHLASAVSFANAGGRVQSDPATLLDLYNTARVNPEEFRGLNLKAYIGSVSTPDLEQLTRMQKDPKELRDAGTLGEQLSDMHDQMKWGTGDKEKKGVFDKTVREEIDAEQKRTGKVLGYEDRQKIIERMVVRGKGKGDWFLKSSYFEAKAKGEQEAFVPEVPERDRKDLQARFKAKMGRAPTEAELMVAYRRWKGL